jgi:hypothetical protein
LTHKKWVQTDQTVLKKSLKIAKGYSESKNRPHNDEQKDKQRSKEHIHKTKGRVTWTPLKSGVNSGAPEGKAVPTKYAFVCEKHISNTYEITLNIC